MAELDSQPKSVQSLYAWYSDGKLFVNRRYQRKLVWTLEEKQRLIESILNGYPIPAILLADRADGSGYEIIDGLQRLHTIVSFIESSFSTLDGDFFAVEKFPTANERAQEGAFEPNTLDSKISAKEVTTLLDYSVAVSVMRGSSEREIDDVFGRINTYGHRLSDQERRQAGVKGGFAEVVRDLACTVRGDKSSDILDLSLMPSISIDLPKTKHGYEVRADEVFWVTDGVLRSTDLRDSMDEQCLADIAACIVGGKLIERSKVALDRVYGDPDEFSRIGTALEVYGDDRLKDEVLYCIDEIRKVSSSGKSATKLKNLFFSKPTNNAFPALFATVAIAFHEALIGGEKKIADYDGAKSALQKLDSRIDTGRSSTTVIERQKNVDTVKGLLQEYLADSNLEHVYSNHSIAHIDAMIRRSEIELPEYELKQGLLALSESREVNSQLPEKILRTICAIANNGKGRGGSVLVGVADKNQDVARIVELDGVSPRKVGSRHVVGVKREALLLGETTEDYFIRWKNVIKNSQLSSPLKEDVLASTSFHEYYGLGILLIGVPGQNAVSYLGDDLYFRSGDDTTLAKDGKTIAAVLQRFQ